jgi:prepilin-type N-terminal cleavage/methylation domain-containing protein
VKPGFSLLEMIAALAVLAVGLGVSALALPALRTEPTAEPLRVLRQARTQALMTGRPVTVRVGRQAVLFGADGSASTSRLGADSLRLHVDPLTGVVRAMP